MTKPPLILLVDDETHIVNVLSVKLHRVGFRVTCASDGREAMNLALGEEPDLVITDYKMPVLDGHALCEALLQFECTRGVPVILLTGRSYELTEPWDNGHENIKAIIEKPFSPREVL